MGISDWFSYQLKASGEGFTWAVEQVVPERHTLAPPSGLGEWCVARHIFHMLYYERTLALPHMRHWLGEPLPLFTSRNENRAWQENISKDIGQLLAEFRQIRAAEVEIAGALRDELWSEKRETIWGNVDLKWVATKTYQHTADHTNTILTMALFWESFLQSEQEQTMK